MATNKLTLGAQEVNRLLGMWLYASGYTTCRAEVVGVEVRDGEMTISFDKECCAEGQPILRSPH